MKLTVQGFCILGSLQADFSLYYSTSTARVCGAFSRSEYNLKTSDMEDSLRLGMDSLKIKLLDRRTKECKAFESCIPDEDILRIFTGSKSEDDRFHLFFFHDRLRETFKEFYIRQHKDEFSELWRRHRLRRTTYYEIVHELTTGMQETMRAKCLEQYEHQDELWAPRAQKVEITIENNGYI